MLWPDMPQRPFHVETIAVIPILGAPPFSQHPCRLTLPYIRCRGPSGPCS